MFIYKFFQKLKVIRRFNYILLVLFKAGFNAFIIGTKFKRHVPVLHRLDAPAPVDNSELPIKFRQVLEKLGPVFVKFGQILSTRSDLLPEAYIQELEKLQTQVPPFSYKEAEKIIKKNFGKPAEEIFKTFEHMPFASASLGQVYRATLQTGEVVAVKVQRPGAKQQIKIDTAVLLMLAKLAEKYIPSAKEHNTVGVVQEFQRWTINELDYRKEATNGEIFSNLFKSDPQVYSPKVYWDYSGDSVLTLEMIDGDSLGDVVAGRAKGKVNKKIVAKHLADAFIKQYFEFGYFHADPHPGNIFVIKGNKLMFLDFGMVGFLDTQLTTLATGVFLSMMQRDVEKLLAIILQVEQKYDERATRQSVEDLVNVNGLRKDLTQLVLQWASTGRAGAFTKTMYDMLGMAVKNGVSVPVDLVMFSKSIMTLDAVVHDLDESLKIEEWERPMVEKMMVERFKADNIKARAQNAAFALDELLKRLPESTATIVSNLEKGRFGMELNTQQLMEYEKFLNANSRFNTFGTLVAGVVIALALIYQSGTHPLLIGIKLPGWGVYAGLGLLVLFYWRTRRRAA